MIEAKNIYWLAGLLEGEGTFYIQDNRYPNLQYGSSDIDIVYRAARMMKSENRVSEHRSKFRDGYIRKKHFRVSVGGNLAVQWMMTIYPLMSIRRKEQIKSTLEVWKNYTKKYSVTKAAIKARLDRGIVIKKDEPSVPCINPFVTRGLGD